MINKSGVHGTTIEKARHIRNFGFKAGAGRAGNGIYFWKNDKYGKKLAIAWVKTKYRNKIKDKCSIITVDIIVEDEQFIDFEDELIKERIIDFYEKKGLSSNMDDKSLAAFFDLLIIELEKELGASIEVIQIKVTTPAKEYCSFYPIRIIGLPLAYVVRNSDCIQIESIEEEKI